MSSEGVWDEILSENEVEPALQELIDNNRMVLSESLIYHLFNIEILGKRHASLSLETTAPKSPRSTNSALVSLPLKNIFSLTITA